MHQENKNDRKEESEEQSKKGGTKKQEHEKRMKHLYEVTKTKSEQ